MSARQPVYRLKSADAAAIRAHLAQCCRSFVPPLDERVELSAYAEKIFARATTFEAWSQGVLVGLLAAYLNDRETRTGFITSVSVTSDFAGRGIAKELVQRCIAHARALGFAAIRLEVHPSNARALSLYSNAGFAEFERRTEAVLMILQLDAVKGMPNQ